MWRQVPEEQMGELRRLRLAMWHSHTYLSDTVNLSDTKHAISRADEREELLDELHNKDAEGIVLAIKLRESEQALAALTSRLQLKEQELTRCQKRCERERDKARALQDMLMCSDKVLLDKKQDLSAGESFALNAIDKTGKVEDLHLVRSGSSYLLELRGKTGEPRADRPVAC